MHVWCDKRSPKEKKKTFKSPRDLTSIDFQTSSSKFHTTGLSLASLLLRGMEPALARAVDLLCSSVGKACKAPTAAVIELQQSVA